MIYEASVVVPCVDPSKAKVLARLWLPKILSNVHIFWWRLLLNKLPTRMELANRDIIEGAHNVVCPLCFLEEDDVEHVFGYCTFTNITWSNLCENVFLFKGSILKILDVLSMIKLLSWSGSLISQGKVGTSLGRIGIIIPVNVGSRRWFPFLSWVL
ncbi:hypothetical protein KIW84_052477 [Lathyrus oleraceus]|uniref:Reverse transcriptase zinc-binding domain-containing protein n=1 Tax=Pisum sativum TaxID=3888 RepID=A0A9D5AHH1_PEA|nr:hypothetical protein KIW84_052477 [Pisum sativum]